MHQDSPDLNLIERIPDELFTTLTLISCPADQPHLVLAAQGGMIW